MPPPDRRAYYIANRERLLAQAREYRQVNGEKVRASTRRWRQANPEIGKRYRETRGDRERLRKKAWRQANPQKAAEYASRRRARRLSSATERYARSEIYDRDDWRCQLCGGKIRKGTRYPNPMSPSIDHIIPLTEGGADAPSNVQAAHLRCNRAKQHRSMGRGEQLRLIG